MAGDITYREDNKVKWVGVRPAHNGDQIVGKAINISNETETMYTVPANKILYLTHYWHFTWASAAGVAQIYIADAVPALYYRLSWMEDDGAFRFGIAGNYDPPLELGEGYTIKIQTNVAGVETAGGFVGWLDDE